MKKKAFIFRLVCSIVLLTYLLFKIDFAPLRETLPKFRPQLYLVAIVAVCIYQYLYSLILKMLLSIKGNKVATWEIFRLLTISIFFGVFLPGAVGPDIILAYNLSRSAPRKEDALSAIIFTRMITLVMMLLIAFIISLSSNIPQIYVRFTSVLLAGVLLLYFAIGSEKGLKLSRKLFSKYRWANLIYQTHSAISSFGKSKRVFLTVFPIFILTASLKVLIDYIIALSLRLDISLLYFFILIPLISIVTAIPVTISGIGVREGAYVKLLSIIGVDGANSFSISILSFSLNLLFCIAGAIMYGIKGTTLRIEK